MRLRAFLVALTLLGVAARADAQPPRLVVIVVVDQMRADYVDRFQADWTSGLKRLFADGAVFPRTAYPYLTTVTCAGHATIGSGAFPHTHGVFQNTWYDRTTGRMTSCTEDPAATSIEYSGQAPTAEGDSARRLKVPSLAETLRLERGSRVVSIALKARSAIMLAGHGGDAVSWMSESLDSWQTSTAFGPGPVGAVATFIAGNPIASDFGKPWERMLPEARYPEADAGQSEDAPRGWTATFPHVLKGQNGSAPDAAYFDQWQRSPFADAYVGRMASHLARAFALGQRDATDVLLLSFSSPDLIGHPFGPLSQEVRDEYARLDRTMGSLLNDLDQLVGVGRYVLALSADHGVTAIPEQIRAQGGDAGRISAQGITTAVEGAAASVLGPGRYVARTYGNDIYLEPGAWAKLTGNPAAMSAVLNAVRGRPGVERVFRRDELNAAALASGDRLLRSAALTYVRNESGDLMIAPKAGWISAAAGTTHGSANPDDQRVPLLFFGHGIKPGRYEVDATPADLAPTLAAILGISLPHAEGRALTPALVTPPAAQTAASPRP